MSVEHHTGSCHCGAVAFEAEVDIAQPVICNCSRCQRLGSVLAFTPRANFTLLRGEDELTEYTFNTHAIRHEFCRICGIQSFSYADGPDGTPMVAINCNCLDGVDPRALPAREHRRPRALIAVRMPGRGAVWHRPGLRLERRAAPDGRRRARCLSPFWSLRSSPTPTPSWCCPISAVRGSRRASSPRPRWRSTSCATARRRRARPAASSADEVTLSDLAIVRTDRGGLTLTGRVTNGSQRYRLRDLTLAVRLRDCPDPAAAVETCPVIGEATAIARPDAPPGQIRALNAHFVFSKVPPVVGTLRWDWRITAIRATG